MFCCHYVSLCLTCLPGNKYWRKLLFHYLTSTDLSSMRSYGYLRTVLDVNKSNWCGPRHCQTVWWYIVSTQPASAKVYKYATLRQWNSTFLRTSFFHLPRQCLPSDCLSLWTDWGDDVCDRWRWRCWPPPGSQYAAWLSTEHQAASTSWMFFLNVFAKCTAISQNEL